ncbi:MAG TPA: DUF6084 family protein [Chloroflexota bacterium]|nr:DUF6084 family protein [Chloroflexota bacterium]
MPDLDFRVEHAEMLPFAAAPSLLFRLRVANATGEPVRAVMLGTQVRIAPNARHYTPDEQEALVELFGAPSRWSETLKSLLWAHTTVLVPPFTESAVVDMPVPCTYDFEVASAKYFASLEDGTVPLEFLFSGTVFYAGARGLQAEQLSWEKEARYALPVRVWQETMEHYFPRSAWLRVRRETFDRLYRYKARHGLPTWDDALERLLCAGGED